MMSNTEKQSYFTWESFWLGGFSILSCAAFWLFVDKSTNSYTISNLAFLAAFAVNHPHFLSSYILLYGDFRKNILTQFRYFWAAVVVPLVLLGAIVGALATGDVPLMAFVINSMFFFVGWHYTKQIFGCVIVSSARSRMYF